MATINIINVSVANDGNGDTLRNAFVKTNDNFSELNTKKVEVELGKGLSENDFTDADKTKLDGIQAGAQVQLQSDWNQTDNLQKDYIRNKPIISTSLTESLPGKIADATSVKLLKDKQDEGVLVENLSGTQSKRVLLGKKIKFSGATVQANGDDAEVVIESKTPLRVYLQVGANNTIAEEGNPNKPFADLYYWYRYFYNSSITYMEVVLLGVNQTFTFNGSFVNTWIDPAGTIQLGDNFIPTKFISLGSNNIVFDCSSSTNKQVFFTYDSAGSQYRSVYFDMPTSNITLNSCVLGQHTYGRNPIYVDCKTFTNNNSTVTDTAVRGVSIYVNIIKCKQLNTVRSVNSNYAPLYAHETFEVENVTNIDTVSIHAPYGLNMLSQVSFSGLGFLFSKQGNTNKRIIRQISSVTSNTRLGAESGYTVNYSFIDSQVTNLKLFLNSQELLSGTASYTGRIVSSANGVDLNRASGATAGIYYFKDFVIDSGAIGANTWNLRGNGTFKFINCTIYATQKLFTYLTNINIEIINSTILVGSTNYVMSGTDDATNNIKIINSVTDGLGWIEAPSTLMVKTFLGATPTT